MSKKQRRELTQTEINQLCRMNEVRLPVDQQAAILEMSTTTLRDIIKRHDDVRLAVEKAKSNASQKMRRSLYQKALDGNPALMIFWCKTQEGMRETDRLELSGPDGGPMKFTDLSTEQRKAKLEKLLKMRAVISDEVEVPVEDLD